MITPASLSQLTFMATWEVPYDHLEEEEKNWNLIYRGVISVYQCKPEVDSGCITAILKSGFERQQWRRLFLVSEAASDASPQTLCVEGEVANGLVSWSGTWEAKHWMIGDKEAWARVTWIDK